MPLAAPTEVRNNSSGSLYAVVSQSYTPEKGEETEATNGIRIDVRYTNMDGAAIDPASIRVSTDFYAIVTVSNKSGYERYADLALTHIFPAGWEITSERDLSSLTYQDIRDDRVLSYFDLNRGESKEIPVKLTATYKGRYYLQLSPIDSGLTAATNIFALNKAVAPPVSYTHLTLPTSDLV